MGPLIWMVNLHLDPNFEEIPYSKREIWYLEWNVNVKLLILKELEAMVFKNFIPWYHTKWPQISISWSRRCLHLSSQPSDSSHLAYFPPSSYPLFWDSFALLDYPLCTEQQRKKIEELETWNLGYQDCSLQSFGTWHICTKYQKSYCQSPT